MNCQFCNKKLIDCYKDDIIWGSTDSKNNLKCNYCAVSFVVRKDNNVVIIKKSTTFKNKKYHLYILPTENTTLLFEGYRQILELNSCIEFIPETFLDKLKMLLVFS